MKDNRKEYALEYAGFWIRVAAALIDLSILIVGLYILYCVISQSFFWIFPDIPRVTQAFGEIARGLPVSGGIIGFIVFILLMFLISSTIYFVACWAGSGQTLGKLSLGIKVIRTDSSPIDLRFAFLRFLGCMLCAATVGIGFILVAFDVRKQGLHDRIADTYVVKMPVKQIVYNQSLAQGGVR